MKNSDFWQLLWRKLPQNLQKSAPKFFPKLVPTDGPKLSQTPIVTLYPVKFYLRNAHDLIVAPHAGEVWRGALAEEPPAGLGEAGAPVITGVRPAGVGLQLAVAPSVPVGPAFATLVQV